MSVQSAYAERRDRLGMRFQPIVDPIKIGRAPVEQPPPPPKILPRAVPFGSPIDLPHAHLWLFAKKPTPKQVIEKVASLHGLEVSDILGNRRFRRIVTARHDAIEELRRHFSHLSTISIGKLLGLDHSSVVYALHKRGIYSKARA